MFKVCNCHSIKNNLTIHILYRVYGISCLRQKYEDSGLCACVYVCVHVYISAPQIQRIELCHSSLAELDVPQRCSNKVRPIQQQFSKTLFKPLGV